MRNLLKKRIVLLLTIILGLGLSLSAIYFMYYRRDSRTGNLSSGLVTIDFKETSNVILSSNLPVVDAYGLEDTTPYSFTVKNTSKVPVDVEIKLDVKDNTTIPLGAVRYGVFINDKKVKKDYVHDNLLLYTYEEMNIDEEIEVKIYFWIDYYYDVPNEIFNAKIKVEAENIETLYKPVTVTFDANGGTVDTLTKEVGVGSNYGELPTPTRSGYKFMGWNGKNLINILEKNITCTNEYYKDNTSNPKYEFKNNTNYTLSFSYNINSASTSLLSSVGYGDTSYKKDLSTKSYQNNERLVLSFLTPSSFSFNPSYAYFRFVRMSTRGDANVDIFNIQLEEGNTATEWEPYYVTSSIKVTQTKDHTLKAIWEEDNIAPTLSLSKITYLTEDFTSCDLTNATVNNGVVSLNTNTSKVRCNYFDVNYGYWYIMYDGYTTTSSIMHNDDVGSAGPGSGGMHVDTSYFDEQYSKQQSSNGYNSNGNSPSLPLNTWSNNFKFAGYGATNVKYLSISFSTGTDWSQPINKIRNLKVYGDAIPNDFYLINITSADNYGVVETKYAKGNQTAEYFRSNGTNVQNNQVRVTENGTYTVYVRDEAGNETIDTIEITNIQ